MNQRRFQIGSGKSRCHETGEKEERNGPSPLILVMSSVHACNPVADKAEKSGMAPPGKEYYICTPLTQQVIQLHPHLPTPTVTYMEISNKSLCMEKAGVRRLHTPHHALRPPPAPIKEKVK